MCCLLTVLVFVGPRAGVLVWWLINPARWQLAFPTFIWSLLGFIFAPWTTITYVLVFPGGVTGFDWVWLGLGALADIAWWAGAAERRRIPSYSGRY